MSPVMAQLSIDQVNPPTPPAPPAPPKTEQGEPGGVNAFLESIRKGKSLRPIETKVKDSRITGSVLGDETPIASSSKQTLDKSTTLTDALSAQFDKFKKNCKRWI